MTPAAALEASAVAKAMREWLWLYPSVEIVHIVGIALLFGSIAVLDLRMLGFAKANISVRRLQRHVLPWTASSFLLIVPSGLLMFTAHATDFLNNPVFPVKLGLILLAGVNAALFHTIAMRTADVWDVEEMKELKPPPSVRLAGAASLLIWISVIACGRLLAYF